MSKGFHRLEQAEPWSNAARPIMANGREIVRDEDGFGVPAPTAGERLIHSAQQAAEIAKGEAEPASVYTPTVPPVDFEPSVKPKIDAGMARAMGFTGNTCVSCGSMQMVRNGTCEKCNDCGSTTGCS